MASVTLLVLQAASALAPAPDQRLLHPVPSAACHLSTTEIVVCAKDADTYRLPKPGAAPDIKGPQGRMGAVRRRQDERTWRTTLAWNDVSPGGDGDDHDPVLGGPP